MDKTTGATEALCRYTYDALDPLAGRMPIGQADQQHFYQKTRLATHVQGQASRRWLQATGYLLAQQHGEAGIHGSTLLATTASGSVLHGLAAERQHAFAYLPYGNRHPVQEALHLPGFNGERPDPVTGHYLLGNGYRAFNPILMRFNSPDSLSPFREGGLNAYGYCAGDPVNRVDDDGHTPRFIKSLLRPLGLMKKATPAMTPVARLSTQINTNAFSLGEGTIVFETIKNGKPILTVHAHGHAEYVLGSPALVMGQEGHLTPDLLDFTMRARGVDYKNFEHLHLIACNTANGPDSFASQLAKVTGLPVKGYRGTIISGPGSFYTSRQMQGQTSRVRQLPNGKHELLYPTKVYKENIFKEGRGLSKKFAYYPVWNSHL